jgi:Flp pilus assembly protein TadD
MRTTTAWATLLASVVLAANAFAQSTTTAEGFVLDNDGNPIADAKVLLDYKGHVIQKYRTKTDKKGKFIHVNVYSGTYDITVSKEGLGEATFKNFAIHDIGDTEKAPVFRIGKPKAAPTPTPEPVASGGGGDAVTAAPVALPQEMAAALAADLDQANAAMKAGQLDAAIAGYEAVAAKLPNLPGLYQNLGLAYSRKKDLPQAEAAFRKAIALKPDLTDAHRALSVVLYEQGKREEALVEAAKAAESAPDNARLQFSLGVMYADAGKAAEAKEALLKAETLDPQNAEVEYQLGTLAVAANQKAEAISRMEKYLAMAPATAPNVAAAKAMIAAMKK